MSKAPMMASPHDYRELMKAQFQFGTDKTVEQVQAEIEARREEERRASKVRSGKGPGPTVLGPPPAASSVPQSELDKVRALLGQKSN